MRYTPDTRFQIAALFDIESVTLSSLDGAAGPRTDPRPDRTHHDVIDHASGTTRSVGNTANDAQKADKKKICRGLRLCQGGAPDDDNEARCQTEATRKFSEMGCGSTLPKDGPDCQCEV